LSPDGYLAKCGTDKSKLLRTNIWLTDMSSFAESKRGVERLGVATAGARDCRGEARGARL